MSTPIPATYVVQNACGHITIYYSNYGKYHIYRLDPTGGWYHLDDRGLYTEREVWLKLLRYRLEGVAVDPLLIARMRQHAEGAP